MIVLSDNEKTAMEIYAKVKDMRGDFESSDPDELAEFASMCLNTVIHLGGIVERITQAAAKEESNKGAEAVADLPTWLRWVADELVKRDTHGGTFAPGVAQSLRGRAYVLELASMQAAAKDTP